jgi:hypothetical protein
LPKGNRNKMGNQCTLHTDKMSICPRTVPDTQESDTSEGVILWKKNG